MVATGDPAAQAAKAAGLAVSLVFVVGQDPVRAGLVTSMNRPGMATGVNFFTGDLGGKRLELLCAMVPSAHVVGLLLNPSFGTEAVDQFRQSVATAAQIAWPRVGRAGGDDGCRDRGGFCGAG